MFTKNDKLLIAVSGGVDSVVLCHLCYKAGYSFTIAHCNFNLRGEESDRDEAFVRTLGEQFGAEVLIQKFETEGYATENKIAIQEAARKLRYDWFYGIVNGEWSMVKDESKNISHSSLLTPDYILTAHHLDDNIETVLMNFFKGTGISGLRGILPKQQKLVRPLLIFTKKELLAYAEKENLMWVEDSSNSEVKYTRNYFRHTIIPLIEKVYPEVVHNIANTIDRINDVEVLYNQAMEAHKKGLIEQKGNEIHIPILKLLKANPLTSIVYEIIKEYGFSSKQTGEAIKLLHSESGKYITSATHRILHNRKWLIIAPLNHPENSLILVEKGTKKITFDLQQLKIELKENKNATLYKDALVAQLDAKDITYPLLLRKWKEGDYFYPLGMKKKKKLSRFFIDNKLSPLQKENIWVLESAKKIVWIIGYRIDDRFKITESTKTILQLSVSSL